MNTMTEIGGALTCDVWVQMSRPEKEPGWRGRSKPRMKFWGEGDGVLEDGVP